jgi:signal peptidase I
MNNINRSRDILKNVGFNLLAEGKTIRIKAHGYSMYPAIKPGSIILIEPISLKGKPVPGEIIAIKREDGLVVHRLVRLEKKDGKEFFVARGDSNSMADNPEKIGRIAGRIIRAETSGEDQQLSDIRINTKPKYILNRLKVIGIILLGRIKRKVSS